MLIPMNRASRMGFYGGLLGISIVIFLWGFEVFGENYEGPSYSGNLTLFVVFGCLAALPGIISVLVTRHKPLFISILLLVGACLGFYQLTVAWLPSGIMMLIGAYRSVKAMSNPELLLDTQYVDMRPAKVCIIILTMLGLMALMVGLALGPRVGGVFPVPTVKP